MSAFHPDDSTYPLIIRNADGEIRNSPEHRTNAAVSRKLGLDEDQVADSFGYSPEPLD
jgi:hypothetical protein